MNRTVLYQQLPISVRMPGGFCWYLAGTCWEEWACRANKQMLSEPVGQDGVEILKRESRRFIFRLKSMQTDSSTRSVVIKSFPMFSLKDKLLRYSRYGPAEVRNLLEASRRKLPVPVVFGYGLERRLGLVWATFIMMEDLHPRELMSELLKKNKGQPRRQAELLDRTIELFVQLYRAGCNHIDTSTHSIWFDDNTVDSKRISDFQYARFLEKPSIRALLCQAAYFARSCSDIVPAEIIESWIGKVITAAEIKNSHHWLKVYKQFLSSRLSRDKRLAVC